MTRIFVNAIVLNLSGNLRGVVENIREPDTDSARIWVRWEDGIYSSHAEKELRWAMPEDRVKYKKSSW